MMMTPVTASDTQLKGNKHAGKRSYTSFSVAYVKSQLATLGQTKNYSV